MSRWWRPKAGTDGSRLTAAEGSHMKNPLGPAAHTNRCSSMLSRTTGGWLRSHTRQSARARRPAAKRRAVTARCPTFAREMAEQRNVGSDEEEAPEEASSTRSR